MIINNHVSVGAVKLAYVSVSGIQILLDTIDCIEYLVSTPKRVDHQVDDWREAHNARVINIIVARHGICVMRASLNCTGRCHCS